MVSKPIATSYRKLHDDARDIFAHALQTASIPAAFDRHLRFEGSRLLRSGAGGQSAISLDGYARIHAIALGKAALPLLETLLEKMPRALAVTGICCAPSLPGQRRSGIDYYAGGHPSPNEESFHSARAALQLLDGADDKSFVFFLISGGGSAMFELPLDRHISLEDTVAFHRALVGSGASIAEINTVRKHFSAVKGGRLAGAAPETAKFTLLVSDVPSQHLDALSSGPTLPDSSSVADCREVLRRYDLLRRFPPAVRAFFLRPDLPETPGRKRDATPSRTGGAADSDAADAEERLLNLAGLDGSPQFAEFAPEFARSQAEVLLSNRDLLTGARERAEAQGWKVMVDNTCDDWDYREAARYLLTRVRDLRREHSRLCLLSGGEVTVRLGESPGTGGRNQQFSLACALELASGSTDAKGSICVLSAGSDGIDGNSPAAGAIADNATLSRAREQNLDPQAALDGFDSYPLFHALGDTLVTGPTNNNLRDLRILLSE